MKHFPHLLTLTFIAVMLFASCSKEEALSPDQNLRISLRDADDCTTVDLTYPATVNVDESFDIEAAILCGRVALDRAYVLDMDGVTHIYSGLTCDTEDLLWEEVVNNECFTEGLSETMTLDAPGTYVFRTKHTAADGNCDGDNPPGPGNPGECTEFNGVNFCCFVIEALEVCVIDTGDYWTYSHGFYMQSPTGTAFLNAHPELGPVSVGCDDPGTTTIYTLQDIMAMDPGNSTPPGILVKQIITMTLNVSASSFLGSGEDLGCLIVVADDDPLTTIDDLFAGMTVDEIIAAANAYAGGCDTTTFSEGDLTAILAAIVNNFHEGTDNQGLLTCCE